MNNTPSLVVLVKILRTLLFVLFEFSKFKKYLFLLFFFSSILYQVTLEQMIAPCVM